MSEWVELLRAPPGRDLSVLCRFLQEQGVDVWVFERDGDQCVCVPSDVDPAEIERVLQLWEEQGQSYARLAGTNESPSPSLLAQSVLARWREFPLTLMVLIAALVCYLMALTPLGWQLGGEHWLMALAFQQVTISTDQWLIRAQWPVLSEIWRVWTPALLHFSFFHILFNGVMMLELGRRLEMAQGCQRWLLVVLFTAGVSNTAQFIASPDALFGGLSGVVYALIGYGWVYQRIRPSVFLVAPGLMWVALIWQLLCFSGVVTWAGLGNVANTAHVAGLLAGLLLGWMAAMLDRDTRGRRPGLQA